MCQQYLTEEDVNSAYTRLGADAEAAGDQIKVVENLLSDVNKGANYFASTMVGKGDPYQTVLIAHVTGIQVGLEIGGQRDRLKPPTDSVTKTTAAAEGTPAGFDEFAQPVYA